MGTDEQERPEPVEIPEDAMAIRQSRWAWRLYVIPWIFFWLISLFVDRITFGVLPMILAVATILPAYLRYSKTEYILTHTHLVVRQGEFFSRHRYDIPISEIAELHARPGFLGENLGMYQSGCR